MALITHVCACGLLEDPSVDYFPSIARSRAPLDERVRRFLWQFGDELPPFLRVARIDNAGDLLPH